MGLKDLYKAGGLGLGIGTFLLGVGVYLQSPSLPAITLGAAIGAAFTGAKSKDSAQAIRNRLSTSIKDPDYNPHLASHQSVDELNYAAKKASGSLSKTFLDVVKARIKG